MCLHFGRVGHCLGMIHKRHPDVAARLVHHLEGHPNTPSLQAAAGAARSLRGVQGFEPPWSEASPTPTR